jgi:hypothetical protein
MEASALHETNTESFFIQVLKTKEYDIHIFSIIYSCDIVWLYDL